MNLVKLITFLFIQVVLTNCFENNDTTITKRALQKSHEKSRIEKLTDAFIRNNSFAAEELLIQLIVKISNDYLLECTTVLLYHSNIDAKDRLLLEKLFLQLPGTFIHGQISPDYKIREKTLLRNNRVCLNFLLFLDDIMKTKEVIGHRKEKIVIVTKSSQWRVFDFLINPASQSNVNLLVVVNSFSAFVLKKDPSYILYTNELYTDALGSSKAIVLTSYLKRGFTRKVNLFPKKMTDGFSGHRFIVAMAEQPPFVIKKFYNEKGEVEYDGIEIRLLELLAKLYNFTTEYKEAVETRTLGSGEAVIKAVLKNNVNLGIGGIYITQNRVNDIGIFPWHSQDCASFISLASTALPRYRAIMGPFEWTVWILLTFMYLLAIFLFSLSDKLTLRHLIDTPEELENMFWYVYGTFTNCFVFSGKAAWSKAEKASTKLLVGFYWIFTIIITSCYTGSIIAFVTLPTFPEVVDYIQQLLDSRYQIGMLDKGGWQYWFHNLSDPVSQKLLKKVDYVPDIISGLKNVTKAFFWPYALLASKEQLDYIVRTNFTLGSKRQILHISAQCFMPFNVGVMFPKDNIYQDILTEGILLAVQSGFMDKIKRDVEWDMLRTATGKLLPANAGKGSLKSLSYEDRSLNLDDTQGMFLLLGIGFLAGAIALISEWFGGCFNILKRKRKISACSSIVSNPRLHESQNKFLIDAYRQKGLREWEKHSKSLDNTLADDDLYGDVVDDRKRMSTHSSEVDLNEEIGKMFNFEERTSHKKNDDEEEFEKNARYVE